MDPRDYIFPGLFVLLMFGGSYNAKFLAPSLIAAFGLVAIYPNWTLGSLIMLFYIPALLVAGFRE